MFRNTYTVFPTVGSELSPAHIPCFPKRRKIACHHRSWARLSSGHVSASTPSRDMPSACDLPTSRRASACPYPHYSPGTACQSLLRPHLAAPCLPSRCAGLRPLAKPLPTGRSAQRHAIPPARRNRAALLSPASPPSRKVSFSCEGPPAAGAFCIPRRCPVLNLSVGPQDSEVSHR